MAMTKRTTVTTTAAAAAAATTTQPDNKQTQHQQPDNEANVEYPSNMAAVPAAAKDPTEEMERVVKKELTDSEASCLLTTFSSQAVLIALDRMKDRDINSLYIKIQRMVKTDTKSKLVSDYIFDGLVPMAFGQQDTVLQYVIRGSDLYCAKIGDAATIETEVKASRLVHEQQQCPSVMPVFDIIHIDENRVAMVCPYYPIPVSHTNVNEATIVNVALCGLATIKAFSNKQLCHGDIKPSNMMFQAGNRTVVSIDFGSCTAYGNMLTATSPAFGMDCGTEASLLYDLTCISRHQSCCFRGLI